MPITKRNLLYPLLLVLLSLTSKADNGLTEVEQFGANPGNLDMLIYMPSGVDTASTSKLPLVIALHGCNQSPKQMAQTTGWNNLADQHRFLVVYPHQKRWNNISKCFNWFNPTDLAAQSGETASIKSMLDYTLEHYPVAPSKIYIYGLSAGAAMANSLMLNFPNHFQVGALFAGGAYKIATNSVEALQVMNRPPNKDPSDWGTLLPTPPDSSSDYPRLLIFHGTQDNIVTLGNAYELIDQWCYIHHCDTIPNETQYSFADNPLVTRVTYGNPNRQEAIVFYKIEETGHAIPVNPGKDSTQGGHTGIFAVDRNFYSTYYVAKEFGLLKK